MNIYSNTTKILTSFLVSVIMFAGVQVYMHTSMNAVVRDFHQLQNTHYKRLELLQELSSNGLLGGIATRNKIFRPKLELPHKVVKHTVDVFNRDLAQVRDLTPASNVADNKLLDDITQRWARVTKAREQVFSDVAAGNMADAEQVLVKDEHPDWQQIRRHLQALVKSSQAAVAKAQKTSEAHASTVLQASIWISIVALLIGLTLIGLVMTSLSRRLGTVTRAMHDIAAGDGDLRKRLPETGRDEITELSRGFNQFVVKVQDLVREITESTSHLAASAEEMATITHETRENTRRQTEQTEMVAAAINEMTATTKDIAQNTNETASAAQETDEATRAGKESLSRSVESVNKLVAQMRRTAKAVHELEEQTTEIGTVLEVIRGVAEQTNLLALNAAIEAARAGEHGRGFAVVAEEVRNLASRTQQSTEEIRGIIEKLQERANKTGIAMQESEEHGQETIELTGETDQSLDMVIKRVDSITQMTLQIAAAAEEQSAASEEINRNLSEIRVQSEHLDESSEQVSTAGSDLTRLAANLDKLVGRFRA